MKLLGCFSQKFSVIEKLIKEDIRENSYNKILILGSGESGKSTLHRQIENIYNKMLENEKERKSSRVNISPDK
jgi:stage III sporulation protein SpoIIIAA